MKITKLTVTRGAATKTYTLDNGAIQKSGKQSISEGRYEVIDVADMHELRDTLDDLTSDQCIMAAVPINGSTSGKLVTKASRAFIKDTDRSVDHILSRTNDCFFYTAQSTLFTIDYDPEDGTVPLSPDELRQAFISACPALAEVEMLWRPSASNGVVYNGERQPIGGQRLYMQIDRPDLSKQVADRLQQRLWINGFGHVFVSANGSMTERSLIDKAMYKAASVDYAAGARVEPPLSYEPVAGVVYEGASCFVANDVSELTSDELAEFRQRVAAERKRLAPLAASRKGVYIAERVAEAPESERDTLRARLENGDVNELGYHHVLHFDDGTCATCGDIIDAVANSTSDDILDPASTPYHRRTLADPLEPYYGGDEDAGFYGVNKAVVYIDGVDIRIESRAHHGQTFKVIDDRGVKLSATTDKYLPVELITESNDSMILKSDWDTGKTQALINFVKTLEPDTRVIWVNHSVTLIQATLDRLTAAGLEFAHYNDDDAFEADRLIITPNSLHKLRSVKGIKPYDIVLVDECEQVLAAYCRTGDAAVKDGYTCMKVLRFLMRKAKRTIMADAGAGALTTTLARNDSLPNFQWLHHRHQSLADVEIEIMHDCDEWHRRVAADLEDGSICTYVCCSSKSKAKSTAEDAELHDWCIRQVHSDNPAEVSSFLARIRDGKPFDDNTISSPVINAGVSIDDHRIHTVYVHGDYGVGYPDADCLLQMMMRPRGAKRIVIYTPIKTFNLETNVGKLAYKIMKRPTELTCKAVDLDEMTGIDIIDPDILNLAAVHRSESNRQVNNFSEYLHEKLSAAGATVTVRPYYDGSTPEALIEAKERVQERELEEIATAAIPDLNEPLDDMPDTLAHLARSHRTLGGTESAIREAAALDYEKRCITRLSNLKAVRQKCYAIARDQKLIKEKNAQKLRHFAIQGAAYRSLLSEVDIWQREWSSADAEAVVRWLMSTPDYDLIQGERVRSWHELLRQLNVNPKVPDFKVKDKATGEYRQTTRAESAKQAMAWFGYVLRQLGLVTDSRRSGSVRFYSLADCDYNRRAWLWAGSDDRGNLVDDCELDWPDAEIYEVTDVDNFGQSEASLLESFSDPAFVA